MSLRPRSFFAGAVGAVVLTLTHETVRQFNPVAPRMDLVGARALRRWFGAGGERPAGPELLQMALAGDLVANTVYYAAVDAPTDGETWRRAALLGVAAGLGALVLPQPMGLGHPPHSERADNQVMTVAWYLIGALAAAAAANATRRLSRPH